MNSTLARLAAGLLVLAVSGTSAPFLAAQQSTPPPATNTQPARSNPNDLPPVELPENPGHNNNSNTKQQPLPPAPQQQAPAQPNGTAVAPPIEVSGGAASKPAGVAIAPPKQRRIRSLLIKLGFLAGAGVAIGTVVGLSAASPSHVPNSPGH